MKFDITAYSRMNVLQSLVANFKESQPFQGLTFYLFSINWKTIMHKLRHLLK